MNAFKAASLFFAALLLMFSTFLFAACVSGGRVMQHTAVVNHLVDTVNADAGASKDTRDAVQAVVNDTQDMAAGPVAQVKAAQTGDWTTLALAGFTALTGIAGSVVTYKKVNADRDATSLQRTAKEVVQLRNQPLAPLPT